MRKFRVIFWAAVAFALLSNFPVSASAVPPTGRAQVNFNPDWKFSLGDPVHAEAPRFDDTSWRTLDVPHDWSIEGAFDQNNPTGGAGAFLPAGVGWYRKRFTLPVEDTHRPCRVAIEFEGVMANSDVWINGIHLGKRPSGYVGFRYDLTPYLHFGGASNLLAVRADNAAQPASRWYAGAGIYRPVRLIITNPVHFELSGIVVTAPQISAGQAVVHVKSVVQNKSEKAQAAVVVRMTLLRPDGRVVQTVETRPQGLAAGKTGLFEQDIRVKQPERWDITHPVLYLVRATVRTANPVLTDSVEIPFGIRDARFDAATGFWLNDKNLKIKGVCLHQDAGALGVAVPLRVWESRLRTLKTLGVNAVRTAHAPPAPEFLDLCDRMGFLVLDEMFDTWTVAKNPYDYHRYFSEWSQQDTRDTVRRDRNHPSIILYSIGNEIRDTPDAPLARRILLSLRDVCHENDPTRPVTQALFRPNASHDYENGLADLLDVIGQNYREPELLAAHENKPTRRIIGTENGQDRRVWLALRDNPAYAGQFLWTGIDYLGEARRWPVVGAGSGLLDRTGTPRPLAYERQSWWSDRRPMVYIARRIAAGTATPADPGFEPLQRRPQTFSDWTPQNREPHDETVEVYSSCEQVDLLLNGKSLGRQPLPPDAAPRTWKVPFEPGTLKAVGFQNGKPVAEYALRTAGPPARILLTAADSARITINRDDVCYVKASVVDQNAVPVPMADNEIQFALTGPGIIAAVDSADNSSHEPFRASARRAFQGSCFAVVRARRGASAGTLTLTASSPGLAEGVITIAVSLPNHKENQP